MTTTETLDLAPYAEVKAAIAKMKSESAGLTFDYETPKGNKLARSHVASLRSVKGDIERKRKELKADALEYGRKVDAVAKELTGEIEAMIEVHQGPLDLIESREEARKMRHLNNIAALTLEIGWDTGLNSIGVRSKLTRISDTVIDDKWEEFKTQALEAQAASRRTLEAHLAKLLKSEAEAAELARLREEQAKRDAENRAKQEAEARAKREEEIRAAAEAKAKREAADAAMAEARKKEAEAQAAIAAEREKTRKAELAAAKARQEKAEAEAKAAREEQEKREAEAKRAANAKHREKILEDVAKAIALAVFTPGDELQKRNGASLATSIAEAIAAGKIPHVKIEF